MPYYQYRCNDCEHEFETRQRMSDDPLTECPVCEGHIRRVVNSVGVVFKGSGFYVTDTRNGKSATISPDSSKTADTKTSENGTTDSTKPETTAKETSKSSSESKTKESAPATTK